MSKNFLHRLPPIAADFSGACSTLVDWNVEVLLLSPGSCGKVVSQVDESRLNVNFLETEFNDLDIARGINDLLVDEINNARNKEKKLVILGTPVTAFLGIDYKIIEENVENCITIPMNGFHTYKYGVSKTLFIVGKQILDSGNRVADHINIVGYTPLNLASLDLLNEHIKILEALGFKSSVIGRQGSSFGETLNWVVSEEGIELARWMEDQYKIPYIVGLPVGRQSTYKWLNELEKILNKDVTEIKKNYIANITNNICFNKKVVVIGEQFISNEIATCLKEDFGCKLIESIPYNDEIKIEKAAKWADICICDSIYKPFFLNSKVKFIQVPYIALSGKYNKSNCKLLGNEGYKYLLRYLK